MLVPATALAGDAMYRWSYETRSYSYIKSVCTKDPYTVTETVTQEIFNRASGTSAVGNGRQLPRGSSQGSGRIRRNFSKTVQGPDAAPPEDKTITEGLPMVVANWGAVNRGGNGRLTLDIAAFDHPARFVPPKKGRRDTFSLDTPPKTRSYTKDDCVYEERTNVTGTMTIERVR